MGLINKMGTNENPKTISRNKILAKKRRKKPSTDEINNKSEQRCRKETILN